MCKASIVARDTRDAEIGDRTILDYSSHGLPQFVRAGDGRGADACVTCPKDGQRMRISGIPVRAQEDLRIDDVIEGTFIEAEDDATDSLLFDGRPIDLGTVLHSQISSEEITVEMLAPIARTTPALAKHTLELEPA